MDKNKLWNKGAAECALGIPSKSDQKFQQKKICFPQELILGPEQIKAINSEDDITLIIGDAGSGKTLVLLALLFKYTGKHVIEKKLRKVIFFIPRSKIHFRKDVDFFIKKYCHEDWVQIREMEVFHRFTPFCCDNIYLVDEFYTSLDSKPIYISPGIKLWLVTTSTSSEDSLDPIFSSCCNVKTIYFRKLHRSDPLISKVCAKLRKLIDQKIEPSDIFPK